MPVNHNNLMLGIMEDMEPEVLLFIVKHVRSFTRWDLLKFLYNNQSTWDTSANLASYIGRSVEQVEVEVVQMAEESLLYQDTQAQEPVYALVEDSEILASIGRLVTASQDRTFRMKLVYHILRAGGSK